MEKKLCELCGEHPVGKHKQKYCDDCAKNKYQLFFERDVYAMDRGEFLGLCPRCKTNERMAGNGYCRKCRTEMNRQYLADKRGIKTWFPLRVHDHSTICRNCQKEPRLKGRTLCKQCYKEHLKKYFSTYVPPAKRKKVADPEAYYQETKPVLTCPICQAEFCIPKLPMGLKCKMKICSNGKYISWQKILRAKGIRVPEKTEYAPEEIKRLANCIRCKEQPRQAGYLYCSECLNRIKLEREQEFQELMV